MEVVCDMGYGLYKIISIDQNKIHSLSVLRALINSSKRSCISRTRSENFKGKNLIF